MVRGDDDHRAVDLAVAGQVLQQTLEFLIHECDLRVVGLSAQRRCVLQRRAIWQVGIEIMHPGKKRRSRPLLSPPVEPVDRGVGHLVGRTLVEVDHIRAEARHGNLEIIEVETPVQAEPRVHHKAGDEGGGVVAMCLEDFRKCGRLRTQGIDPVVVNSVTEWGQPGQDRRV